MNLATLNVLKGLAPWSVECAEALGWLRSLPDDSCDLLVTSPPYEKARTYGIGDKMLSGQDWVNWMVQVVTYAAPKVRGLIAINCEGQTRNYAYSGVPYLLFADLHRAGFNMRKPPIFSRVGIPGSGGPDWLRNDYESVVCVTRPGKLPWSDNTACGHPPKWAPGGEMSHRVSSGKRVNQWGPLGSANGMGKRFHHGKESGGSRKIRPSHKVVTLGTATRGGRNGDTKTCKGVYDPPVLANPGNILKLNVGGGQLGDAQAHENEAPFPLGLPEFFVKSFCPPGGIVLDCFAGSGTTGHAARKHGRRFIGCDIRPGKGGCQTARERLTRIEAQLLHGG